MTSLAVLTQYQTVTDGQTRQTDTSNNGILFQPVSLFPVASTQHGLTSNHICLLQANDPVDRHITEQVM